MLKQLSYIEISDVGISQECINALASSNRWPNGYGLTLLHARDFEFHCHDLGFEDVVINRDVYINMFFAELF